MPVPVMLTCDMCTVAWPEFVTVDDRVLLLPTVTFPKASVPGFSANLPTGLVVPLPVIEIVAGDCGSLLLIDRLPDALPVLVGEKDTLIVADCPALTVFGVVIPLTPNSAPFKVITEMFKSEPPVFVSVTLEEAVVPVVTLPNPTLAGLAPSCAPAGTALATSETGAENAPLLVTRVRFPLEVPVEVPVNMTERLAVAPETSEKGNVIPETVNCLPLRSASVMLRVVVPEFLIATFCVTFLPTMTFPKFKLEGVN